MLRYFGIVSLAAMLLLTACSPERNLARKYVKQHNGSGIMIVPLYELFKDNLTISFDTAVEYTPEQFDSIAWVQSYYIQHVSDSVFLTAFTNSMITELTSEGYDVYVDGSSDVFLSLPDPKWIISLAQMQLNEDHSIEYYDMYAVENGEPFTDSIRINKVSLSTWLDVSRANTDNIQLLYLEGYVRDIIKNRVDFNLLEGSVGLEQHRDSIKLDDVYKMAFESGRKHAELLFDYFMNDYIRENLPAGVANRRYFHYNRKSNTLILGLKEQFEVVN